MEYIVHIIHPELIEGVAKRTGNPYKMVRVQGIIEVDGQQQIFRTVLPQDSEVPALGRYKAKFQPRVDNQSMELGGGIVSLVAAPAGPATPPKS